MLLSKKANLLKPSPTMKMSARANELKSQGHDVVNLTVGEPDWNTFSAAKAGGLQAIESNFTKYTPAAGMPELKQKVAKLLTQELGVTVAPNEVAIGPGAKFLIYSAFQMLLDQDDEVIVPAPFWVSYPTMIELCGARPVIVETLAKNGFKPTIEELENKITSKTKMLLICSPSNPTGTAFNKAEVQQIAALLKKHPQLILLSDDIYNRLYFGGSEVAPHVLHSNPELKDRVVCIGGASKSFAMTGWRIGWVSAHKDLVAKMSDYLSQTTSNPSSISQKALLSVLDNFESELKASLVKLKSKKDLIETKLKQNKVEFVNPDGAFYFFINISPYFNKVSSAGVTIKDSLAFTESLLNEKFVAAVAGSDFGCEGWLRLSYASSEAQLEKGFTRLFEFMGSLK